MITPLNPITLRSGETVEAAILTAPESTWASRMLDMLSHKGDPWNWQNAAVLERDLELDAFFYVLHRDGQPFANIMTVERNGVGIFGHVWTNPADRQKGASTQLMALQMANFQRRGGRALYLNTGSPVARAIYERFGFNRVEPESSLMHYFGDAPVRFEAAYFRGEGEIRPLTWRHWPAACPLFAGNSSAVVRAASLKLFGRCTPEGAFLPLLKEMEDSPEMDHKACVLELETGAVTGMATWGPHPLWPDTCIVDIYCHECYWERAGDLLASVILPDSSRYIGYADASCPQQGVAFETFGFQKRATLPNWLPTSVERQESADIVVYTKQ